MDRMTVARQVALTVAVFAATLFLLLGLTAILRERGGSTAVASPSPSVSAGLSPTIPVSAPAPSATATTPPSPRADPSAVEDDPVLVGAGDIARCDDDDDEATAELIEEIIRAGSATVFTAGDNVYPRGEAETFAECFDPSWGRFKDAIRPAPGNHDWAAGSLDAYRDYFGEAARNEDGDPWYAYTLGTWQIVVLDSDCEQVDGCGPDSRQGRWLAEELAASSARCTLAVWHHPRFSSGTHGDIEMVAPFWDALYAAGADVVVNGHDHDYERFAPRSPAGVEDRERGIREFVVGTGGTNLRRFGDPAANSELRAAVSNGVLAFTLKDGSYDWRFLPTEGDLTDRGTAFCH